MSSDWIASKSAIGTIMAANRRHGSSSLFPSLFGKGHVLHSLLDRPVPPGPRKVLLQCQETCLPLCAVLKVRSDTLLAKQTLLHEGPIVLGQHWLLPSEPQANYCYWGSPKCTLVSRNSHCGLLKVRALDCTCSSSFIGIVACVRSFSIVILVLAHQLSLDSAVSVFGRGTRCRHPAIAVLLKPANPWLRSSGYAPCYLCFQRFLTRSVVKTLFKKYFDTRFCILRGFVWK